MKRIRSGYRETKCSAQRRFAWPPGGRGVRRQRWEMEDEREGRRTEGDGEGCLSQGHKGLPRGREETDEAHRKMVI